MFEIFWNTDFHHFLLRMRPCATPHCGFHPPSSGCLCESCPSKRKDKRKDWNWEQKGLVYSWNFSIHLLLGLVYVGLFIHSIFFHVIPCYSWGKLTAWVLLKLDWNHETSIKVAVALRDVANEVYWKRCHPNSDLVKGWHKYVQV